MHGARRLISAFAVGGVVAMAAVLTPGAVAASGNPAARGAASFSCTEKSGGTVAGFPTPLRTVRVHSNHRFDRFVIELRGPLQQFDVRPQASSTFVLDPSGLPVTLQGTAGLLLVLRGAQAHDGFRGPTDLTPGFPVLREARQLGDFEGVVSWGLGLSHTACFRVRAQHRALVVDIQH